jgi:hypothetical protein
MNDVFSLKAATTRVTMEIERLKKAFPELEEDLDLMAGMIEGETDFEKLVDTILDQFQERLTMREAVESRAKMLQERAQRFGRSADALKGLLHELVKASGQTNIRRPLATLVISKGRKKLELDPDFHAQGYMRVTTEPMKTDITAALNAGNDIPGARLVEGEPTFSVRSN